ncbi:SAM-dependent methyltransferase [Weizmannia acidilactici]|jgi:ubiquinone/menaquinone biosynthesis C-methylase UbiE|uniref:SAM-dependent methyltransferase n=2 Tax=Heyndrickxia TaxID=2837504 RepID=A0A5J4JNC5_9BACI|nr:MULTISPECIES: class I SAM-dependent methyltransferase [Heyndrickxia]KYC61263.1 Phosphatidylethanolamine N-methyltransferase [Heyndrickxia coagulans]MEC2306718.1 methyltransferase domain-containing protein [Weizmannia sp. CD-2023]MEC2342477.1 methyltransferase domain-containing protein [Weizmannia sp. CD-2023]MEC5270387.1 methyltransferase domain-containing protein [Heyndrickxia coagulans]MED4313345.1 methyltransferase domain-containing protein [Heyndrickxia coagulans]
MGASSELIKKKYNRISKIYDVMDRMIKEEWREDLLESVHGTVLEVGVGTGANLEYYPNNVDLIGIDFSPGMLKYAEKKAADHSFRSVRLKEMDVQQLAFPDNTFDYIVSTCVFCSVYDPVRGMKEMRRVCKPNGKILFLEHMRSENPVVGKIMDVINPLTVSLWGANINRRTVENILKAGLKIDEQKYLAGTIVRLLITNPNKS